MKNLSRIYIPLDDHERTALIRLGIIEKRDPRKQGAIIIRRELERLGLIQVRQGREEQNEHTAT